MNRTNLFFKLLGKRINREERMLWACARAYEQMRRADIRHECGECRDKTEIKSAIRNANRLIKLWEKWGNRTSSR